jgi:hypothetical protein
MPDVKPSKITLRSYQVGFGDCFLLIFEYPDQSEKFVLIDFGTTGLPDNFPDDQMFLVARNIMHRCKGKLDVVVATHRHQDHISGFDPDGAKKEITLPDGSVKEMSTGEIIKACRPEMVIQPWTEAPDLDEDAREPAKTEETAGGAAKNLLNVEEIQAQHDAEGLNGRKLFTANLRNMHKVAHIVVQEAVRLGRKATPEGGLGFVQPLNEQMKGLLTVMGENNIKNAGAVKNLREMSPNPPQYVHYGKNIEALAEILPGVRIEILGPPTVEQYDKVLKQRSKDNDEFWMLRALNLHYWQLQAETSALTAEQNDNQNDSPDQPFPQAPTFDHFSPSHTRWFIRRMREARAEQLLGIVRILDKSMNNTSLIMLFVVDDKTLLFPGDAQIENWEYVLKYERKDKAEEQERQTLLELLKATNVYKVGHHGSRNATPRTLWKSFLKKAAANASEQDIKKSMRTVCSTMPGKHGHTDATKVPRQTLVDELKTRSQYQTTELITREYRDSDSVPDDERGLYFEITL